MDHTHAGLAPKEPSGSERQFLTDKRIEEIGTLVEPLIRDGMSWIERRREGVTILDDTALRRQISVDFSMRREGTKPLMDVSQGSTESEQLFCAPVFMLPKTPANLMAFDLVDEKGQSLRLTSRTDNARISGVVLVRMAQHLLDVTDLPDGLKIEFKRIAEVGADEGEQRARRLRKAPLDEYASEVKTLVGDPTFSRWLSTLAHSSLLVVIFRAPAPGRKMFKLRFEEPIASDPGIRTSLGWDPYRVWVDSPLIDARTYHFEAEAPPGLRITDAKLSDDGHPEPVADSGFLRRVHLYRQEAVGAGAGTALMQLRVTAAFSGGAVLAALLVSAALVACAFSAGRIATNPSTAPTLLLFLPGLIATYVARPEEHALTTRLLSSARRLVILVAFLAYTAAARVALAGGPVTGTEATGRAEALEWWLFPLAFVALVLLALLVLGDPRLHVVNRLRDSGEHREARFVAATPEQIITVIRAGLLLPKEYELVDERMVKDIAAGEASKAATPNDEASDNPEATGEDEVDNGTTAEAERTSESDESETDILYLVRSTWHGYWTMMAHVSCDARSDHPEQRPRVVEDGCWVVVELAYESRMGGASPALLLSDDRRRSKEFLRNLQTWAVPAE